MSYMDRALKAKDRRFARVLGKLGYQRSDMAPETANALDGGPIAGEPTGIASMPAIETQPMPDISDLDVLRIEYELVVGKKPHPRAKADTLRAKIAEAKASA